MYCNICYQRIKSDKNWIRHCDSKKHWNNYNRNYFNNKQWDYRLQYDVEIDDDTINSLKMIGSDCESIIQGYLQDFNDIEEHKYKFKMTLNDIKNMPYYALNNILINESYKTLIVFNPLKFIEYSRNIVNDVFVVDNEIEHHYYDCERDIKLINEDQMTREELIDILKS